MHSLQLEDDSDSLDYLRSLSASVKSRLQLLHSKKNANFTDYDFSQFELLLNDISNDKFDEIRATVKKRVEWNMFSSYILDRDALNAVDKETDFPSEHAELTMNLKPWHINSFMKPSENVNEFPCFMHGISKDRKSQPLRERICYKDHYKLQKKYKSNGNLKSVPYVLSPSLKRVGSSVIDIPPVREQNESLLNIYPEEYIHRYTVHLENIEENATSELPNKFTKPFLQKGSEEKITVLPLMAQTQPSISLASNGTYIDCKSNQGLYSVKHLENKPEEVLKFNLLYQKESIEDKFSASLELNPRKFDDQALPQSRKELLHLQNDEFKNKYKLSLFKNELHMKRFVERLEQCLKSVELSSQTRSEKTGFSPHVSNVKLPRSHIGSKLEKTKMPDIQKSANFPAGLEILHENREINSHSSEGDKTQISRNINSSDQQYEPFCDSENSSTKQTHKQDNLSSNNKVQGNFKAKAYSKIGKHMANVAETNESGMALYEINSLKHLENENMLTNNQSKEKQGFLSPLGSPISEEINPDTDDEPSKKYSANLVGTNEPVSYLEKQSIEYKTDESTKTNSEILQEFPGKMAIGEIVENEDIQNNIHTQEKSQHQVLKSVDISSDLAELNENQGTVTSNSKLDVENDTSVINASSTYSAGEVFLPSVEIGDVTISEGEIEFEASISDIHDCSRIDLKISAKDFNLLPKFQHVMDSSSMTDTKSCGALLSTEHKETQTASTVDDDSEVDKCFSFSEGALLYSKMAEEPENPTLLNVSKGGVAKESLRPEFVVEAEEIKLLKEQNEILRRRLQSFTGRYCLP